MFLNGFVWLMLFRVGRFVFFINCYIGLEGADLFVSVNVSCFSVCVLFFWCYVFLRGFMVHVEGLFSLVESIEICSRKLRTTLHF